MNISTVIFILSLHSPFYQLTPDSTYQFGGGKAVRQYMTESSHSKYAWGREQLCPLGIRPELGPATEEKLQ